MFPVCKRERVRKEGVADEGRERRRVSRVDYIWLFLLRFARVMRARVLSMQKGRK